MKGKGSFPLADSAHIYDATPAESIDPFNVCKHRKPRLGARAAWGQKNGAANRPAYCVKEKQTSLIDKILLYYYLYLSIFVLGVWLCFVYTNKEGTNSGLLESSYASPTKKNCTH